MSGRAVLPTPGAAELGDHICMPYNSDAAFRSAVTEYFSAGIRAGERIGFFAPSPKLPELTVWLASAGFEMNRLAGEGQVVVEDVTTAYIPTGIFDGEARIRAYEQTVREALDDGFAGLRVVGDVATILDRPDVREGWASYELRADILATRLPFAAICSFDRRVTSSTAADEMPSVHSIRLDPGIEPPLLRVVGSRGGIAIEGEVDYANAGLLRRLLVAAVRDSVLVIDVSCLSFIDAAGMRAIYTGLTFARENGVPVEIIGSSPLFTRLWTLMGLDELEGLRVRR